MLTKEDIKLLQDGGWDAAFRRALQSNYMRGYNSLQQNHLAAIYERAVGRKPSVNWGCPHCVLDFLRQFGRIYNASVEALSKAEEPKAGETISIEDIKVPAKAVAVISHKASKPSSKTKANNKKTNKK